MSHKPKRWVTREDCIFAAIQELQPVPSTAIRYYCSREYKQYYTSNQVSMSIRKLVKERKITCYRQQNGVVVWLVLKSKPQEQG